MATGSEDSDPAPAPVIVIDKAGGRLKPSRPWYARSAYCLPAMYLTLIAGLWLIALVIPPAVGLPITGMLAIILMIGPVGLIFFFVPLPLFVVTNDILAMATLFLTCAGNCFLLYRFGGFLDS